MTPYLVKFIKTFGYLYFLRKLNEENASTAKLEDDVQRHSVHNPDRPIGSDNVESEILQTEKVRH